MIMKARKRTDTVQEQPDYLVYLLRLWRSTGDSLDQDGFPPAWRASLQTSDDERAIRFGSLDELFDFLRRRTAGDPTLKEDQSSL